MIISAFGAERGGLVFRIYSKVMCILIRVKILMSAILHGNLIYI